MRDKYYLAIGIDEYPGAKRLNNAVGDVHRISSILEEKYGFRAIGKPLLNQGAKRENILSALHGLTTEIGPNDDLIIYYAGHGNKAPTSNAGYWEPADFEQDKVWTRIENSTVLDFIEGIDARHILLISDSCFSGTLLERNRSGAKETDHETLDALKSGWILVSGGIETVGDGVKDEGSPFSQTLCRTLQNNTRPSMSAGELFEEVIRVMAVNSFQTPEAAPMRRINQGGEMIFRLQSDSPNISPEFAVPPISIEHAYLPRTLTAYSEDRPALTFFYEPEVGTVVLDELVSKQKRVIILGGAGSGKSIELSKAMERIKASDLGLVPIFRRLNNYTDGDIEQFLPEQWRQVPSGRLVVLLDGLDEIQPQFMNTALRKIGDFGEKHPDVSIVISCRTNFYELPSKNFSGTLAGFQVYMLNDVNLAAVSDYVQASGSEGELFVKEVQKWGYLDLVQKPYFLNILLNFFQQYHTLEVPRADVLNNALDRHFEANREHFKHSEIPLSYKELVRVAERIAFVMEVMGKNHINDEEAQQVTSKEEEYRSLRYLPAFKYDQEKEQWYFEHNNIQEYLASRVLKRQSFKKMIEVLTLSSSGINKIKPTWVNTLSFMISIGDDKEIRDILDWLIKNEAEILVRFDPDRLPLATRIGLFKQIFEHYKSLQIWLSSNKFSDFELARFAQSAEAVEYLLSIIESKGSTRIDLLNASHILRKFEIAKFPQYADRVKQGMLQSLERGDFSESDQYSIIGSLADLGFTDPETIDRLVQKFGQRENQYLRAALYKLIGRSSNLDAFADLFIAGMTMTRFHYQSKDRSKVTLMDEDYQLKAGIEKLQTPEAIRKLLGAVTVDINSVHQFFIDFKDEMAAILAHIFAAYDQDPSLFQLVAILFARQAVDGRSEVIWQIVQLIDERHVRWEVMQFVLAGKDLREYEVFSAASSLINEETVDLLIAQFKKGTIDKELLFKIYNTFQWRQTTLPKYHERLSLFRDMLVEFAGLEIKVEPQIDRAAIFKQKAQQSFNLLFDKQSLKEQVDAVYAFLEKDVISHDDLHGYKHGEYVDITDRFSSTTAELIRNFTYGNNSISNKFLQEWIGESEQFEHFQIELIRSRLMNLPELEVSKSQLDFIVEWVKQTDVANGYTWYFIRKFNIALPEQRYLNFTRYFSPADEREPKQPGLIELLVPFVTRQKIATEVEANISRDDLHTLVWVANAGYALRNNLKGSFERIIEYLINIEQTEQRCGDLLRFWFEQSGGIDLLIRLVEQARNNYLRNEALQELQNSGNAQDFLRQYYLGRMESGDTPEPDRLIAANRLILLGIAEGFEYLAKQFLSDPSPDIEFRHFFSKITHLTDVNAISLLMNMLYYAKQPDFKRDVFDDLEPLILETLFNIGVQSRKNFKAVKEAMQAFIAKHQKDIAYINFLDFTITKIEDQLNLKLSREFNLAESIQLLDGLK